LEWLPRKEIDQVYQKHDLLLFPSLRDSGGMVVLESMSNGKPVVCLDLGGPGVIVDNSCGCVVATTGRTEEEVVDNLAKSLLGVYNGPEKLNRLSAGALKKSAEMSWSSLVKSVYSSAACPSGITSSENGG